MSYRAFNKSGHKFPLQGLLSSYLCDTIPKMFVETVKKVQISGEFEGSMYRLIAAASLNLCSGQCDGQHLVKMRTLSTWHLPSFGTTWNLLVAMVNLAENDPTKSNTQKSTVLVSPNIVSRRLFQAVVGSKRAEVPFSDKTNDCYFRCVKDSELSYKGR